MQKIEHLRTEIQWNTYRFDQIAQNISERIEPSDADTDIYVGLEHLNPESLHIRRWGTPADVAGTKLRFHKGDVIFGKRRAYQRKLAVAEFDGICSAHAMVLRAQPDLALPEFLPFFLQSDFFFERALAISKGSLSPTINWSDLARQEFTLPPLDEQRRIAEILWAADEAVTRNADCLNQIETAKHAIVTQLTLRGGDSNVEYMKTTIGIIPAGWQIVQLGDVLLMCQYGISTRADDNGRYPIFRMMNFDDGYIVENDMKYINLSDGDFNTYRLDKGDILFNRTNSADLVGKVGIYLLEGEHVFASYLLRLRVDPNRLLSEYLNFYLNSQLGQAQILSYATAGVSQTNVNASNLQKVMVPLPPIEEQTEIVEVLTHLEQGKQGLKHNLSCLTGVKKQLLAELLTN